ncbi:hypothetical protein COV58_01290 [Candidatus Roizmanbacteria bacterium CG11_big_fil_rev_8_21_14_0_20_36_8]|uniref:UmuC domain-containing protein n=2 Tax=Candidatus Roizmaniibacteriota TaxID=1752723 RepID=A0A2M6IV23_9BACT|nr:MAG: hypothetical protein COV58_01290 [Candidatus Roizmanbacteria bacterium CG11_big_fil_rev_8_21_14_0_20_36_8]PIZ64746.1 MAG: hypothetical protein COY14_04100 [Candidatus Roizmanbacteria bacterium CG_4_10_14_0_2_um_filter_36_9]
MFSVIDCNSFYVSCERLFQPQYENRPVVVLSNNDGCVISRSNEAKALQIPMGAPAFKYESIFKQHNVKIFSPNFTLYGDISSRVMSVISRYADGMEIYSIDEAFLFFEGATLEQLSSIHRDIRKQVKKEVGIPVSIGISITKTLSKAANEIAKNNDKYEGVYNIDIKNVSQYRQDLTNLKVGDVWGIGRRYAELLKMRGVETAYQFCQCDDVWIRKNMSIIGLKTAQELRGTSCLDLEEVRPAKQSIISSKSFGKPVSELIELKEAVSTFTTRAAEKLRSEGEVAGQIRVSLMTNIHKSSDPQYFPSSSAQLMGPTDFTPDLISEALKIVDKIYRKGYLYKKAIVQLYDLKPNDKIQLGLFSKNVNNNKQTLEKHKKIMKSIDLLNSEWGSETVQFGSQGLSKQAGVLKNKKKWFQRQSMRSGRYTTRWNELLVVIC